LSRLGYEQTGGVYGSSDRKAIFVGDLIDRGPAIGEVIEIVEGMLRAGGRALTVWLFCTTCFRRRREWREG
jgi:hypothetical protein